MISDYSPFLFNFPSVTFRRRQRGDGPLAFSLLPGRPVGAGTANICVAYDADTAIAETPYLTDPVLYKIEQTKPIVIRLLDLAKYVSAKSLPQEEYFAGPRSPELKINLVYGMKLQGASWESELRPGGTSAVLLVDYIPNYRDFLRAVVVSQ